MSRTAPVPDPPRRDRGDEWLAKEAAIAGRLAVLTLVGLGAIYLLMQVTTVFVGAFLGFTQTALLWPVARRLRRVMPSVVAALLCVTVYLGAFLALFWFIGVRVLGDWDELASAALGGIQAAGDWATRSGIELPSGLLDSLETHLRERIGGIASGVGTAAVTTLTSLGTLLTVVVLAIFLTIFGLTSGDKLWDSIRSVVPVQRRSQADSAFRGTVRTARGWMFASTVTGLVDGLFIGLGLWILGVPLALPIGALTFVLGYVPMVGATLAGAVAVIVALFFGGPITALWALLIVLAVQQIEGNVLSPLLLSRAMEFNPIVTLLLAAVGGTAYGIVGLFLAVPLAGIVTAAVKGWHAGAGDAAAVEGADDEDASEPADAAGAEVEGAPAAKDQHPVDRDPAESRELTDRPTTDGETAPRPRDGS